MLEKNEASPLKEVDRLPSQSWLAFLSSSNLEGNSDERIKEDDFRFEALRGFRD